MNYIPYNMPVFKMLYVGALFMWFFNWLCLVVLRVLQALKWWIWQYPEPLSSCFLGVLLSHTWIEVDTVFKWKKDPPDHRNLPSRLSFNVSHCYGVIPHCETITICQTDHAGRPRLILGTPL